MNRRLNYLSRELRISVEDYKIEADNIKDRVNMALNADLEERMIYMKYRILRAVSVAIVLTAVLGTSVFAMTPKGQEVIGSIISYFQSDKAVEISDIEELSKYNKAVGANDTKNGCMLTLDNVAVDDNFIHIFYTVTLDTPFFDEEGKYNSLNEKVLCKDIVCRLNGEPLGFANHNIYDGYYKDPNTYKGVCKYNISTMAVPDNFNLELYAKTETVDCDLYAEKLIIPKSEKEKIIYISADIDKSDIKINTIQKNVNKKLDWTGAELEKIIFSPFGNQLVLKTIANGDDDMVFLDNFALYDENGVFLDILNTDLSYNGIGESRNSFEFLKADKNIRQLNFVPLRFKEVKDGDIRTVNKKIGTYPIVYELSDYGKVVVTDIRISDGRIDIDYYKDGFVLYDPGFVIMDNSGNDIEAQDKLCWVLHTEVHNETNSYTASYRYEDYDDNGNEISTTERVSAENLINNFTVLGVIKNDYIELDFDNGVIVDLN